jgi:hypothetical protein
MRLLEPDDPSFVPGHGSHLDSHLVDEGEVDSHILNLKGALSSTFYSTLIYGFKMVKGSPNLIDLIHRSHGIEFNLCCFPSLGVELSVDENWPCAFAPSPVTYPCLEPLVFYQLKPLVGQRVSPLWNGQHLYPIPKLQLLLMKVKILMSTRLKDPIVNSSFLYSMLKLVLKDQIGLGQSLKARLSV